MGTAACVGHNCPDFRTYCAIRPGRIQLRGRAKRCPIAPYGWVCRPSLQEIKDPLTGASLRCLRALCARLSEASFPRIRSQSLPAKPPHFWFLVGLAAATFAAAMLPPARAHAQSPDPQARTVTGLTQPGQTSRAGQASRQGGAASTGDDGGAIADDIIPVDDPSQDPLDPNGDDNPTLPSDQRGVAVDGDLSGPAEPGMPRDGVLDPPQDRAVTDGVDPTAVDLRTREERELFETASQQTVHAGYDPLLFQIEDIDPVNTDRRPERLFRVEPYDPIGIRLGGFVYFPEAEVAGVTTNNVLRTPDPASDLYLDLTSSSRLVSDWKVHALEFRSRNAFSFHDEFPTENDTAWSLEARGRLDIAKRTNLQGLISHDLRQEGRGGIDASSAGTRPDVTTDQANLTLNHRFNRLSVQLRGAVTDLAYDDILDEAVPSVNSDRDSVTTEEAVRASWEFKPSFSVFVEEELNQRVFDKPAQGDLILRDSTGTRTRIGVDFGATGEILRGEVSLGVGTQRPDDVRLDEITTFLIDGNLAWRLSDLTSLLFTAQTDIYDTNTIGSGGVASHQLGVEARHAFRKYLVGTAGVTYTTRAYEGVTLDEDEKRATLGIEYYVNREIILFGRYQHIDFNSNVVSSDYTADDMRLGVRVRR